MRHERVAALGVPLPTDESHVRDHLTRTIPGVGDCPQRDGCMLEVRELIEGMRREFLDSMRDTRTDVREVRGEMQAIRSVLDKWVGAKGLRNTDLTPVGRGALDISAGPVKMRGRAWTVAVVALMLAGLLGTIAGGAYVLGEWGRPASAAK